MVRSIEEERQDKNQKAQLSTVPFVPLVVPQAVTCLVDLLMSVFSPCKY